MMINALIGAKAPFTRSRNKAICVSYTANLLHVTFAYRRPPSCLAFLFYNL